MISKSLSTSVKRASLHAVAGRLAEFTQGLYVLLVVHADDFGRLQGDLFTVQHVVDPSSPRKPAEFYAALRALHEVGLIHWYEIDGKQFIQIVAFEGHQLGLHKRTASRFPEFPGNSGKFPEFPSQRTEGKEGKGKKGTSTAAAPLTHPVENQEREPKENLDVIAALILRELLPLGLGLMDLTEAAKSHIAYDSATVHRAIEVAQFRQRMQVTSA
jgi:hypothetical protein